MIGVAILVIQSLFSHANASLNQFAAVANDWMHLLCTTLWIGGLAAFVVVMVTIRRESNQISLTRQLVASFSNYARAAVALLILTGLYAAWLEVGSVDALLHTVYGQTLGIKMLMFVPLLVLAATNLTLTKRGLSMGKTIWIGRLRGLISAEIALTLGILFAVGVMTSGSPARGVQALREAAAAPAQTQPYLGVEIVDNQMMHLQVVPGYVGENEFIVTPFDENSDPINDASLIRLRFNNMDQNIGESELRPKLSHQGDYRVTGANLSIPGHWRIRMTVARPGKFDAVADFNVNIELPSSALPIDAMSSIPLLSQIIVTALSGLGLLGIGAFFAILTQRSIGSVALSFMGIVIGIIFLITAIRNFSFTTITPAPAPAIAAQNSVPAEGTQELLPTNPILSDDELIKAGYTLYAQNCQMCHGETGKGDGPIGLTLNPRPADLTKHTTAGLHPDGQLYEWITNGYPRSAMPAFAQRLSESDRWDLVNYIRTLALP